MAQQIINIGTVPNDKSGDLIRTAFNKVNQNFTELYAATGADIQIPSQSGQGGKYLSTDGDTLSWETINSISNGLTSVSIPSPDGTAIINIDDGAAEYSFASTGRFTMPATGEIRHSNSRTSVTQNVNVTGGTTGVIYAADNWATGYKLVIFVEGELDGDGTFTRHTQVAEATIAATYNTAADPVISVFGVIYTSPSPLATFSVARNGSTIEVSAINSQATNSLHVSVHAIKFGSYYD